MVKKNMRWIGTVLGLVLAFMCVSGVAEGEETGMRVKVTDGENTVVFVLNDTGPSKSLYSQLPLETEVQNYGSNEKIFYPDEKLDETGGIEGAGQGGTLAYFSPWGNVVMFYEPFSSYPGLYLLGKAVTGEELIQNLTGTIQMTVEKADAQEDRQQNVEDEVIDMENDPTGIISLEKQETECWIQASLGQLYGKLRIPNADGPVPLIILSHGFGGTHAGNEDYARYFTDHGFATFNLDFCGGGMGSRSDGTLLEMSVLTEAEDLNAVIDFFKGDSRFSCICLWGASQGGFVTSYTAAGRPGDITALMIEFPAYVLQDDAKERANADGSFKEVDSVMGVRIGRKYSEDAVSFDIYDVIGGYIGPVLILHGDRDSIVPLRYSERAEKVFPNAELVVMTGQDHGFRGKSRQEAMERELAFFEAQTKAQK